MNKILFLIILVLLVVSVQAQKVFNIRAEQRGQEIVVFYSLDTNSPCEVSLLLSQDNGVTWGSPLKNVSGNVGKNILAGEKQITWKVLEEQESLIGDRMKFKVIANGKKSYEPEMILVEGGTFKMGYNYGKTNEKPVHTVTLSTFKIGKYEVTQAQWKAIMGENPSGFDECLNCPIQNVTWNEVGAFVNKLNAQTDKRYRLPTEAEWEFAARGGKKTKGYNFSGGDDIISVAWFKENSFDNTHNAGGMQANELGIFDMTGNVIEWCSDWYGKYNGYNETNPTGTSSGQRHVLRGGCCNSHANNCRTAFRFSDEDYWRNFNGFRLVLPEE